MPDREVPSRTVIRGDDAAAVAAMMRGQVPTEYVKVASVLAVELRERVAIVTPEGTMYADAGDFLVTDVPPTHAWPVRRDVFRATYRPAATVDPVEVVRARGF